VLFITTKLQSKSKISSETTDLVDDKTTEEE
jgi:hypothetical protein